MFAVPCSVPGAVIQAGTHEPGPCPPAAASLWGGGPATLPPGVAGAEEGSPQGLHPVMKDSNTWLQPFSLFLLSFAVRASPSPVVSDLPSETGAVAGGR